jgi:hypothetical protein
MNRTHPQDSILFLIENGSKFPKFDPPKAKDSDVILKVESLISEINNLESKLVSVSVPVSKNAKDLHKRANSLLQKIYKMRKEGFKFQWRNLSWKPSL